MRSEIITPDSPYCEIYFGDDDDLIYEYQCTTPSGEEWYEKAKTLPEPELPDFFRHGKKPFTITTPKNGIVKINEEVEPWFNPWQNTDHPPFTGEDWFLYLMDTIFDHRKTLDRRAILCGEYDEVQNNFIFNPDEKSVTKVLFIFQSTLLSADFQKAADKIDGSVHLVSPRLDEAPDSVDEFIIADINKAQEALGFKGIFKKFSDNIRIYERHQETISARETGNEITSESGIKAIQKTLEDIKKLDERISKINPNYGFKVSASDKFFEINGRKYKYTAGTDNNLKAILKIAKEENLEKLVPQALLQRRKQMETCLMHLSKCPK